MCNAVYMYTITAAYKITLVYMITTLCIVCWKYHSSDSCTSTCVGPWGTHASTCQQTCDTLQYTVCTYGNKFAHWYIVWLPARITGHLDDLVCCKASSTAHVSAQFA